MRYYIYNLIAMKEGLQEVIHDHGNLERIVSKEAERYYLCSGDFARELSTFNQVVEYLRYHKVQYIAYAAMHRYENEPEVLKLHVLELE